MSANPFPQSDTHVVSRSPTIVAETAVPDLLPGTCLSSSSHLDLAAGLVWRFQHPPGEIDWYGLAAPALSLRLANTSVVESNQGRAVLKRTSQPGDWLIIPSHSPVNIRWAGSPEAMHLVLRRNWLDKICVEDFDLDPREVEFHDEFKFRGGDVRTLLCQILAEIEHPERGSRLIADSLINLLATRLIREHASLRGRVPSWQRPDGKTIGRVVDYVNEHIGEDLCLAALAKVSGLGVSHFCHVFRQITGLSPHQYVTQQRMHRAAEMLARTNGPIVDIALSLGFANQSHFSSAFKANMTVSPGQYRRRHR